MRFRYRCLNIPAVLSCRLTKSQPHSGCAGRTECSFLPLGHLRRAGDEHGQIDSVSTLVVSGVAFGRRSSMSHAAKARALLGKPLSLMVGAMRTHSDVRRRKIKNSDGKNKNSRALKFDVSGAAHRVGRCFKPLNMK